MRTPKPKPPLERDVQRAICDYLELRRHFFWRQNTAPTIHKTGDKWAFRSMPKHSMRGVPDILLIGDGGRLYGLEVKRPGGKQSDDQKAFEAGSTRKGAIYAVVTSIDDVKKLGL